MSNFVAWFKQARSHEFAQLDYSYYQTTESNHHRIEIRQYWSVPVAALGGVHNQAQWKGLQSVVMVVSERRLWNKTTYNVRFYLSSLVSNAAMLANAICTHWGIENNVHWVLDVSFKEDASRIRKENAAENFSLLRRMALNLLNREQTVKGSVRMKRYRAAMDNNYLLKVLAASNSEPTVEVENTKEV
jgi:predicted transposase YbfD/YdcC